MQQLRWLDVLRDALAIVIASSLVRALGLGAELSEGTVAWLLLAVFTAGFCASGCLHPERRWIHLSLVALASWLILSLYALLSGSADSPAVYVSILLKPTLLALVLGGAASLAIVRRKVP
jgi:hypothetical protein